MKKLSDVKARKEQKESLYARSKKDFRKNWMMYLLVLPVLVYYIVFHYIPMFGVVIAFKDFKQVLGSGFFENIMNSDWVGFRHFIDFFLNPNFLQILRNTFRLSFYLIVVGFPAPIILALLINEVSNAKFKRTVQTITYLPHFISLVIICGMISSFTNSTGFISQFYYGLIGKEPMSMLLEQKLYTPIYIISDVWQGVGWGSIIYLSAISGISPDLYEAAKIDGAGRWKQTIHVTLPGILPTISVLLILRLGRVLNVGYEKTLLLYNDLTKPVAQIISTYVYEKGLINRSYSFSTAVGLFNSVVNICFLCIANTISKKVTESSLW